MLDRQPKDEGMSSRIGSYTLRTGDSTLATRIRRHIRYSLAREPDRLSRSELFEAVALSVRDLLVERMLATEARYERADAKRLYYLSMEFLIGRSLGNALVNLHIFDLCRLALAELGVDLEEVREAERDAALGNGGLGRLAACFLDSLATLGMPAYGYGINYDYGLFKQEIVDGCQREWPDNWRARSSPWLIERPGEACLVPLYGRVVEERTTGGRLRSVWTDWDVLVGVPHDLPVPGYGGRTVNQLRLFSARASSDFDIEVFNTGDHLRAVERKVRSETVSKVLYPSDAVGTGKELRLVQEYFLVACAVRDILRRYQSSHDRLLELPSKIAVQMNDTHPALAVAELMRALVDEHRFPWERAWNVTQSALAYTNHTLLPEALECWPVALLQRVLPRHLEIIYEINRRFLDQVSCRWPGDLERRQRMSVIQEGSEKLVRMAHLAIVGSHSVNGVSALHSELVKTRLVPDFFALWPERFNNKTNGVTQRRWLLKANPGLSKLISQAIGDGWIVDAERLRSLAVYAEDVGFRSSFRAVKRHNKQRLAALIQRTTSVTIDPDALFDVQAKRIHEYKRQLLAVMGVVDAYLRIVEDGQELPVPRVHLFAGKAAPSYWAAKEIIRLVNHVARVVNADPRVGAQLRVVFVPDYRVSLAERIIPAADVSEQVSTAGTEASGTGNMKFAMNGALTIGTMDGANIEIRDEVGEDNIFLFGLRAQEIDGLRAAGVDLAFERYAQHPRVARVVDAITSGRFSPGEPGLFEWIRSAVLGGKDPYFHLADLPSYLAVQERVADEYRDRERWTQKAIRNVAAIGRFSSDRTVREYAQEIWNIEAV